MNEKTVRKIVAVIIALVIAAAAFTAGFFTHKLTRPAGVSSYEWFLQTVDQNYYFGGVGDDYTSVSLKELSEKYLDRYSEYYTAEEYAKTLASNQGARSGIGVSYSFVEGKGIYVASVTGNSPAFKSGLRRGEILVSGKADGGEEVTFNSSDDFASLVSGTDDGVEITFVSASGRSYPAAKCEYTASYAYLSTNKTSWSFASAASGGLAMYENAEDRISCLPDGTGYICLSQFYGSAASEFYKLIEKFNSYGCTSLIIDLRSNGGGYVSVMQDIAGAFAGGTKKPAMFSRDKYGKTIRYDCAAVSGNSLVPEGTEVYVMANSGTASASEALIGALVCYGVLDYQNIFVSSYSEEYINWLESRGIEVKNERSYGKGIMQSTFTNALTGEALKLTTAQIYWPDGETCIHEKGLTVADGCTPVPAEWEHTLGDGELKAAVGIIASR